MSKPLSPSQCLAISLSCDIRTTSTKLNIFDLFISFKYINITNQRKTWLIQAIQNCYLFGHVEPYTLLVGGTSSHLQLIKLSWSRGQLKPPFGFIIASVVEVGGWFLQSARRFNAMRLEELVCQLIWQITQTEPSCTVDHLHSYLASVHTNVQLPVPTIKDIQHSLNTLSQAGAIYFSGRGYNLLTPEKLAVAKWLENVSKFNLESISPYSSTPYMNSNIYEFSESPHTASSRNSNELAIKKAPLVQWKSMGAFSSKPEPSKSQYDIDNESDVDLYNVDVDDDDDFEISKPFAFVTPNRSTSHIVHNKPSIMLSKETYLNSEFEYDYSKNHTQSQMSMLSAHRHDIGWNQGRDRRWTCSNLAGQQHIYKSFPTITNFELTSPIQIRQPDLNFSNSVNMLSSNQPPFHCEYHELNRNWLNFGRPFNCKPSSSRQGRIVLTSDNRRRKRPFLNSTPLNHSKTAVCDPMRNNYLSQLPSLDELDMHGSDPIVMFNSKSTHLYNFEHLNDKRSRIKNGNKFQSLTFIKWITDRMRRARSTWQRWITPITNHHNNGTSQLVDDMQPKTNQISQSMYLSSPNSNLAAVKNSHHYQSTNLPTDLDPGDPGNLRRCYSLAADPQQPTSNKQMTENYLNPKLSRTTILHDSLLISNRELDLISKQKLVQSPSCLSLTVSPIPPLIGTTKSPIQSTPYVYDDLNQVGINKSGTNRRTSEIRDSGFVDGINNQHHHLHSNSTNNSVFPSAYSNTAVWWSAGSTIKPF